MELRQWNATVWGSHAARRGSTLAIGLPFSIH